MLRLSAVLAAALSLMATVSFAQQPNAPRKSSIGYPSVGAALEALRAKAGAKLSIQGGWTVIEDGLTIWSFTPTGHPAHPAVVKRTIVTRGDSIFIDLSGLCHAQKQACDKLMAEYQELNKKARELMHRK
jgi:hypothetical protein